MSVLAIIPARRGSKGIPCKNFRSLAGGPSPMQRAVNCAVEAGCGHVIMSSDFSPWNMPDPRGIVRPLIRPAELAQDDTPMMAVVHHVLQQIPGPLDQIVVLLQPTQPLRTPAHVRDAIRMVAEHEADSVVSVTPSESPDKLLLIQGGYLQPFMGQLLERRQEARPAYKRDGTVYCTRRSWLEPADGNFYAHFQCRCKPLIIDPAETCALDTPLDWQEAERRLTEAGR